MPDKLTPSSDYATWLGEVKSRIQSARISAAHSVNRDLILLYWDIGRGIVEKQEKLGWGESVVEQLSGDIRRAFPETKGFSPRNLRNMKRLFSTYANTAIWQQAVAKLPATGLLASKRQQAVAKLGESEVVEKLQQLVAEVPWGHNLLILNKLSEPEERATDDNPCIGIILCAEKDDVEVEFALKSKVNPIGVAEYQLKTTLPKELKGKLPTAEELGAAIGLPAKRPEGAKKR